MLIYHDHRPWDYGLIVQLRTSLSYSKICKLMFYGCLQGGRNEDPSSSLLMLTQTWSRLRNEQHLHLCDTLNPFITSVAKSAVCSCSYIHPSSCMLILWNAAFLCNLKCPFLFLKRQKQMLPKGPRWNVFVHKTSEAKMWIMCAAGFSFIMTTTNLYEKQIMPIFWQAYVWLLFATLTRINALWHMF